jgi:hypothetical protein
VRGCWLALKVELGDLNVRYTIYAAEAALWLIGAEFRFFAPSYELPLAEVKSAQSSSSVVVITLRDGTVLRLRDDYTAPPPPRFSRTTCRQAEQDRCRSSRR